MSVRVALNHVTRYGYDRPVGLSPQIVRLRPSPHCRTPVLNYSLQVFPTEHFINWQQDPFGNYLARFVFPQKTQEFELVVDLIAELTVINPFDFFLEDGVIRYPFQYAEQLANDLAPFMKTIPGDPIFQQFLNGIRRPSQGTVDFLVDLNRYINQEVRYIKRMEPGIQSCEETITQRCGSCRDSAFLLVQILRQLGFAARFVSGYLIQLKADIKLPNDPFPSEKDTANLHAWAEVYLPGAGWIGLDPTSGLLADEGHLPLVATSDPLSAAPVTGGVELSKVDFHCDISIKRISESPDETNLHAVAESPITGPEQNQDYPLLTQMQLQQLTISKLGG